MFRLLDDMNTNKWCSMCQSVFALCTGWWLRKTYI